MRFIHQAENYFFVSAKTASELAPETRKVFDTGGGGVGGVADDGTGEWLRGGVAVAEIVVRVYDGVGAWWDQRGG